ncbi:MAG: DNA translocase FtsK [Oscillospiraceae bacterium]|nr:DNA translocase FtsK [Oscillospiraceae bacterium]
MAQKKTTAKSGAKRTTTARKRTTAAKTSKSKAQTKPKEKAEVKETVEQPERKPERLYVRSLTICGAGILLGAFVFFPGSRGWLATHYFLLGFVGVGALALPFILFGTGVLVGQDRGGDASRRAFWAVLLTICISCLWQAYFGDPPITVNPLTNEPYTLMEIAKESATTLFNNGKTLHGGGLLSGLIIFPLIAVFDIIGTRILITLIVIALVMLVTNRSLPEILRVMSKPFVWVWNLIVHAATRGMEELRDDYYDDDDDDDEEEEPEPIEEPADYKYVRGSRRQAYAANEAEPLPTSARLRQREEELHMQEVVAMLNQNSAAPTAFHNPEYRNIDVEVEIEVETEPIPEEQMNRLPTSSHQSGVESIKSTSSEEESFMEMVQKAAEEAENSNNFNRLPWLSKQNEEEEILDEGVYEEPEEAPYVAPPLSLLQYSENSAKEADITAEMTEKGNLLVETLASFGVQVKRTGIRRGPTVTRYEIQPAAGVKISKITSLADDIGLNLGGKSVRIEAPIPGKPAVGVEVPNNVKDVVSLREIIESPEFQQSQSKLSFAVGKDIDGNIILGDIAKMPHMIIAGTTGSGKSVCTNSIIMSILYHASPEEVRMVLIDPKVVEFQPYDGIPHLLIPVVTQPQKAAGALNWAVLEMERRYMLCATYGVRDLKGYNAVAERTPELKKLPQILIVIDEFADLMMTSKQEVETAVIRIAQKARAAGIHLIIATQRPTVDVITGLIKSNVPSRIGMSVKSAQDSRNILDTSGAETLLGNGDLLFYPNGWREPRRVQGCYVTDKEVEAIANFLKQNSFSEYDSEIIAAVDQATPASKNEKSSTDDEMGELTDEEMLILRAAELAVDGGQLSTSSLQRRLKLGYARAARIVDELESRGIVGPSEGAKPRKTIMTPQELTEWKLRVASSGNKIDS